MNNYYVPDSTIKKVKSDTRGPLTIPVYSQKAKERTSQRNDCTGKSSCRPTSVYHVDRDLASIPVMAKFLDPKLPPFRRFPTNRSTKKTRTQTTITVPAVLIVLQKSEDGLSYVPYSRSRDTDVGFGIHEYNELDSTPRDLTHFIVPQSLWECVPTIPKDTNFIPPFMQFRQTKDNRISQDFTFKRHGHFDVLSEEDKKYLETQCWFSWEAADSTVYGVLTSSIEQKGNEKADGGVCRGEAERSFDALSIE